jgi:hypothetical protein
LHDPFTDLALLIAFTMRRACTQKETAKAVEGSRGHGGYVPCLRSPIRWEWLGNQGSHMRPQAPVTVKLALRKGMHTVTYVHRIGGVVM